MWNLDQIERYQPVATLTLPWSWTFADMRPGFTDLEKRERIRALAATVFPSPRQEAKQWAFRIFVCKAGRSPFDIENVPKIIIDAFCARQIRRDKSSFESLGLYPDDNLDHVVLVQVAGQRGSVDSTFVELFAVTQPPVVSFSSAG